MWEELGRGPESLGVGTVYCQQHSLEGTVRPGKTPKLAQLPLSTPSTTAPQGTTHLGSEFSLAMRSLPQG